LAVHLEQTGDAETAALAADFHAKLVDESAER
jgi:hypothetical protein